MNNKGEIYNPDNDYFKSNILVGSKYKSTLLENRLMAICMSRIPRASENSEGTITVKISGAEIKNLFGLKQYGDLFERLDNTAHRMTGRTIGWSNPEAGEFEYIAVVTRAKFTDGIFECEFNKALRKYLKNIESNFTQYSLEIMLSFDSVYSFRLYEILKSRAYTPKGRPKTNDYEIEYNLNELKFELGVVNAEIGRVKEILQSKNPDYDKAVEVSPEHILTDWRDLRKRCIDVAVKEINEKPETRMTVDYKTRKKGRGGKVCGIIFYVHITPLNEAENTKRAISQDDVLEEIMDLVGVKLKEARSIGEAADYNMDIIREKYAMTEGKHIDNMVGWLIAAIKNDYSENKHNGNEFSDFDERDVDWNKLVEEVM